MMKRLGIVAVLACLPLAGCASTRHEQIMKAGDRAKVHMMHTNAIANYYKSLGIADVNTSAPKLYIDGGQYLGQRDKIVLSVGVHEFRGVWANGKKEAVQRVYVEPGLGPLGVEMKSEETDHQIHYQWDKPKLHKTSINLPQRS